MKQGREPSVASTWNPANSITTIINKYTKHEKICQYLSNKNYCLFVPN